MTRLHFASALLPSGWANDVQMVITAGAIAEVTPGVAPAAGDERHGIALPGLASLHSHAFQRGMAGLGEKRTNSQRLHQLIIGRSETGPASEMMSCY